MEPLEGDHFCSKSCSSFTQQLAAQLVNPMERIKPSAMQKALAKPSHNAKRQGVAAQGGGVATMKAVIEVSLSGSTINIAWCCFILLYFTMLRVVALSGFK